MSDSLRVFTKINKAIDVESISELTAKILGKILGLNDSLRVRICFSSGDGHIIKSIDLSDSLINFSEDLITGGGAYVLYGVDHYWNEYSDSQIFEFCITEIPRRDPEGFSVVCLALAIAVAEFLSVDVVTDWSRVWCKDSDEVEVERLLGCADDFTGEYRDRVAAFYRKIDA